MRHWRPLFLALLLISPGAVDRARASEPSARAARIGLLHVGPPGTGVLAPGMIEAFARRGLVEGTTAIFERRAAAGRLERLPALVAELVSARVDVIVTRGYPAAVAADRGAPGLPVVVTGTGDPVATGLVESLARPGGHLTGVSEVAADLSAKRLQLLKEAVPAVRRVALLWNADDASMTLRFRAAEMEAERLGLTVLPLGVRAPDDFNQAFEAMRAQRPDAILMVTDVLTLLNRQRVVDFAVAERLPTMFEYGALARSGGLLAYGPHEADIDERAVDLVVRILRGMAPAELPLELPTRFELVLNLKTAAGLGLTIPASVLVRADELVE